MKVLFAPDWRAGIAYQSLLAEALVKEGVEVLFFRHYYKRVFPLTRLMSVQQREEKCDLLHLHWPEAYYPQHGDRFDWFRLARFSTDLALATRYCPLVVTTHNLKAHNRDGERFERHNMRSALLRAKRVFAHSDAARTEIEKRFPVPQERICTIPFGDLSVTLGIPLPKTEARARLGLPQDRKVCLIFGTVQPYKGLEEVLAHWQAAKPDALLVVAGEPMNQEYGDTIRAHAPDPNAVRLEFEFLDDALLRLWLSAVDTVIFNYRSIFTSGAAALARSYGVPILLPARLSTVDLAEPHRSVFRFESFTTDFESQLSKALNSGSDYDAAAGWRSSTAWSRVAKLTANAYRDAIHVST